MTIQPIRFGDDGQVATREILRHFDALVAAQPARYAILRRELAGLEALDRQYGGLAPLELEDVDQLVGAIHRGLA